MKLVVVTDKELILCMCGFGLKHRSFVGLITVGHIFSDQQLLTDLFDDVSVREVIHLFRGESSHFSLWGTYLSTSICHGCLSKSLFSNLIKHEIELTNSSRYNMSVFLHTLSTHYFKINVKGLVSHEMLFSNGRYYCE